MNCHRCGGRTLLNYGERWCLGCGTLSPVLSQAEIDAARRDRRWPLAGVRKLSDVFDFEVEA